MPTENQFNLTNQVKIVNPHADVDSQKGPYNSIPEALTATESLREPGRTVYIIEDGSVVEYWFKDGIADSDLVVKSTGVVGLDIPQDFIISCYSSTTAGQAGQMLYFTDQQRILDITQYVPEINGFWNAGSVMVEGNNIFIQYYAQPISIGNEPFAILALYDCKIVNNILTPTTTDYVVLPEVIIDGVNNPRLHCEGYYDGFLYYATRVYETDKDTQFFKINAFNLSDYKVRTFFQGGALNNIEIFQGYIYMMPAITTSSAYISKVNTDLENYEVLTTVGTIPEKRFLRSSPFTIYNEEIYIVTVNNYTSINNTIGVQVYDLNGNLKRENISIIIPGTYTNKPYPHWLKVFNGKILFHTANTTTTGRPRKLFRIDAYTLNVDTDGLVDSPTTLLTDDNTITSDGYIYLSNDDGTDANGKLYKVFYLDFLNIEEVISSDYFSAGTSEYIKPLPIVKTKTSDFENTGEDGTSPYATQDYVNVETSSQTLQEVTDNGAITTNSITTGGLSIPSGNNTDLLFGDGSSGDAETTVLGQNLSTFATLGNSTISPSDTILSAFGRTQGQINARATTANPTFTGTVTIPNGSLTITGGNNMDYVKGDGTTGDFDFSVKTSTIGSSTIGSSTAQIVSGTQVRNAFWQLQNQINLGNKENVLSQTADYTVVLSDFGKNGELTIYCDSSSSSFTITLPTAVSMLGYTVNIIKIDSSVNTVTVKGEGTTNINQANTHLLSTQNENIRVKSNGTQYYIL